MLQQALTIGPVSVGLYASSKFQFYSRQLIKLLQPLQPVPAAVQLD